MFEVGKKYTCTLGIVYECIDTGKTHAILKNPEGQYGIPVLNDTRNEWKEYSEPATTYLNLYKGRDGQIVFGSPHNEREAAANLAKRMHPLEFLETVKVTYIKGKGLISESITCFRRFINIMIIDFIKRKHGTQPIPSSKALVPVVEAPSPKKRNAVDVAVTEEYPLLEKGNNNPPAAARELLDVTLRVYEVFENGCTRVRWEIIKTNQEINRDTQGGFLTELSNLLNTVSKRILLLTKLAHPIKESKMN